MKQEETEEVTRRDYYKSAVSICELNQHFLLLENQAQESRQQHNRIDQDFRKYLSQFSVIRKKDDNIKYLQTQHFRVCSFFNDQCRTFEIQLQQEGKDKREFSKALKKLARVQKKAWNLNLDKREDIKVACKASEFPDKILEEIAYNIRMYNRE